MHAASGARTTFPDAAYESYTYFGDSLLKSKTDRKTQTINYAYDHLKRLATKTYPNSTSIAYTYQGQKLTQVTDTSVSPSETHTFSYDNQYRVSSNTQATRGAITYTYDAADRTASYAIAGGPTATYTHYADGSLNTIQWTPITGQFKYAYTLTGQYGTITLPNGQTRNYSYDDQGRLTQLANAHPTAGNLATYGYGYDLNNTTGAYTMLGQRTSMTADVPAQSFSSALTKYYYDNLYQLTRADYPSVAPFNGEVHSWTYDAIGNRLTNTVNGATTNYTYQKLGTNPNNWQRLSSDGTNSYTYDTNGNTATRTGYTFGWDYENRVTGITGTPSATYGYDYSGRRGSKSFSGSTTTYLYDGLNLVSETNGGTTAYHLFGAGIDEPLASSRSGSVVYHSVDGLGSVALASDSAASVQNSYTYDGWGVGRSSTEAFAQPFRYTAREQGELSDQLFYRARFLMAPTGRFLSGDPLTYAAASEYAYVGNDPARYVDPSGAVSVNRGYNEHEEDWNTVISNCGGRYVNGCTLMKGSVTCRCQSACDLRTHKTVYMPQISINAQISVHLATNSPYAPLDAIRQHEHAHVNNFRTLVDETARLGERYESMKFSSLGLCNAACVGFYADSFVTRLALGLRDWVLVDVF